MKVPSFLVSDFSTEVIHNQCLRTHNLPLEDPIRFLLTPKEPEICCPFKVVCTIRLYCMFHSQRLYNPS